MDKDCFRLRQNMNKKVTMTISPSHNNHSPLNIERSVTYSSLDQSIALEASFQCCGGVGSIIPVLWGCWLHQSSVVGVLEASFQCCGGVGCINPVLWGCDIHSTAFPFCLVYRCFGILLSPGKGLEHSQMNLLDNMVQTYTTADDHCILCIYDIHYS